MSNVFYLRFGSGNPASNTGLAPTFLKFHSYTGGALAAPGITENPASSGLYQFTYTPSFAIAFTADAATSGLADAVRYVAGSIDPTDMIDVAAASLQTGIGATSSSFGTVTTDPATLFGYMKRVQELLEGDQAFTKATGALVTFDRAGAVTLAVRTVTNSVTQVVKT